jgi:hypothetical protein
VSNQRAPTLLQSDMNDEVSLRRRSNGKKARRGRCRRLVRETHVVHCPHCQTEFELFAAMWCEHVEREPSKRCPACRRCLCDHPAYIEPHFWKDAPMAFRAEGFRQLFLLYV